MRGLPGLAELLERAVPVELPLRARFRGIVSRETLLLRGPQGWAEFAPFAEYEVQETAHWLRAAIAQGWQEPVPVLRESVAVNATVPAVEPARVPEILARFPGCNTVKIKVAQAGESLADDIARVKAVREAMGEKAILRVDANGGWSVAAAGKAAAALQAYNLDYIEQPCATAPELAALRRTLSKQGINIKIAADESVRRATDPLAVARAGAADLLVIKAAPLGGVTRARQIIEQAGLPVIISSALETSVGISAGVRLAASLPDNLLYGACGLGTVSLFAADITENPLLPQSGLLPVRAVTPAPALLAAHEIKGRAKDIWLDRLRAAHAVLSSKK
ncbi:MAG: o-succinylbenzoate synthase [Microbacteriaceae bacterium]|nr:o-succinylbenzoate synthase [Microbacteriaceae bacterium]